MNPFWIYSMILELSCLVTSGKPASVSLAVQPESWTRWIFKIFSNYNAAVEIFWRAQLTSASLFGLQYYYFFTFYFFRCLLKLGVWRAHGTMTGVKSLEGGCHHERLEKHCSWGSGLVIGTRFLVNFSLGTEACYSARFEIIFWWDSPTSLVPYLYYSQVKLLLSIGDLTEHKHCSRY